MAVPLHCRAATKHSFPEVLLKKQPSLPDVQPNLTVTMRAEGKAGGALIQTMETEIPMENKTMSSEATRNQLMSDNLKNITDIK